MAVATVTAPSKLYKPAMEGMDLLLQHERGNRLLTLERVEGVGIISYILTDTLVKQRVEKKYLRRVLRKSFFRTTVLIVPVDQVIEERQELFGEVYTNMSVAFRDFERMAARIR